MAKVDDLNEAYRDLHAAVKEAKGRRALLRIADRIDALIAGGAEPARVQFSVVDERMLRTMQRGIRAIQGQDEWDN